MRVRGNTIFPATIFGRFKILFTILRQIHLLLLLLLLLLTTTTKSVPPPFHLLLNSQSLSDDELAPLLGGPDVFFVDQLSACLPLIRYLFPNARILFYCHFPDLLLVQGRGKWWKRVWRFGFDWLEGWGMRAADRVVVNSRFTRTVVQGVWGWLIKQGETGKESEEENEDKDGGGVGVVYPCVHVEGDAGELEEGRGGRRGEGEGEKVLWKGKKVVLSINRFERKKGVELALGAFARMGEREKKESRLVIAGWFFVLFFSSIKKYFEPLEKSLILILQQVDTTPESQKTLPTTKNWKPWPIALNFATPPPKT